jgi:hypothetical protein
MKHAYDLHPLFAWEMGFFDVASDSPYRLQSHCELAIIGSQREPPIRRKRSIQRKPGLSMQWVWIVNEDSKRHLRTLWSQAPADVGFPTSSLNT